jgi:hypothetical protein
VEEETDGGEDADRWGPHINERKGKRRVPIRLGLNGPRAYFWFGPEGFPGSNFIFFFSFLLFFFSFSHFLFPFVSFAYLVQIASNQLCKVSKIQNNIPE